MEFGPIRPTLHHFRTPQGREVDIIIERRSGEVVGVEVKSSASVTASEFEGLRALKTIAGDRFVRGIELYDGSEIVQFGDQLYAVPIGWLWRS